MIYGFIPSLHGKDNRRSKDHRHGKLGAISLLSNCA